PLRPATRPVNRGLAAESAAQDFEPAFGNRGLRFLGKIPLSAAALRKRCTMEDFVQKGRARSVEERFGSEGDTRWRSTGDKLKASARHERSGGENTPCFSSSHARATLSSGRRAMSRLAS